MGRTAISLRRATSVFLTKIYQTPTQPVCRFARDLPDTHPAGLPVCQTPTNSNFTACCDWEREELCSAGLAGGGIPGGNHGCLLFGVPRFTNGRGKNSEVPGNMISPRKTWVSFFPHIPHSNHGHPKTGREGTCLGREGCPVPEFENGPAARSEVAQIVRSVPGELAYERKRRVFESR